MANENEPAKLLLPYLQRADELQKHEPLVAYYCRLYAMERGLKIPQGGRTKTSNALLISLMKQLEKDKKSLTLGPDDNLYLEGFASNVFAKADKQDRAGRADLNTAKTFYAASIFFEIINQFGELQPEIEQKQKYAAWKAADIRKALKEGRKPVPGPPTGDEELSILSNTASGAYDSGESESGPATNPGPQHDPSPRFHDEVNHHHSTVKPPSSSSFSTTDYPSQDFSPPPPSNRSENSTHSQVYHQQPYPQEPQLHFPQEPKERFPQDPQERFPQDPQQHFPPEPQHRFPQDPQQHFPQEPQHRFPQEPQHRFPQEPQHHFPQEPQLHFPQEPQLHFPQEPQQHFPQNYPNFQSYPSFSESSLPAAPTHYPSYHQDSDASYSSQSAPPATSYPSAGHNNLSSSSRNGGISEPAPTAAPTYQYDCNYQPAPEKIAEAHKAARFAVGALAFDDVSIAVDFLKKSLELLTNPSAGQQSSPENLPKHVSDEGNSVGFGISRNLDFTKPRRSLLTEEQSKKKQLRRENKQQQQQQQQQKLKMGSRDFNTLEEWFLASPGLNLKKDAATINNYVGEFHVLKQSSNRVYPSLSAADHHEDYGSKARDVSKDDFGVPSLSRSQNGKIKKKVSFKLPEESDIFIIHSPEVKFEV